MNVLPKNTYELNQMVMYQGVPGREKATFERCAEIMKMNVSLEKRLLLLSKLDFE